MAFGTLARVALVATLLLPVMQARADPPPMGGSQDVTPQPGFSCPPAKLWDQDATTRQAVCVDCRGVQPPPEQRNVACPPTKVGAMLEGRDYFCQANAWRPGPWQLIQDTCACPANSTWDETQLRCFYTGDPDKCANLPGIQNVVPPGYVVIGLNQCFPVDPVFGASSVGLMWRNGAQPYWNTLVARVDAQVPGWRDTPPPLNYIRQGMDFLSNAWTENRCFGEPVQFGSIYVSCERSWEDIVSSYYQRGPFYMIMLRIGRM
jgi:hypothetical protein